MTDAGTAFTPQNTAIVLVDHQPGVLAMAHSLPSGDIAMNAGMLAGLAEQMNIPLVVTSTRENLEFLGTTLEAIQQAAPVAYAARVSRAGTLNAFADPAFVAAVAATGRKNLIMAGLLTDVCLFHTVVSAAAAGYAVQVVADASGTSSALADTVTYDRLREMGAVITSTYGALFELFPNLSTPEGQKAESIAVAAVTAVMSRVAAE